MAGSAVEPLGWHFSWAFVWIHIFTHLRWLYRLHTFWFDSSSTQLRSVFNQCVDGELDLSTSVADFSLATEINFDDQSEYAFAFTATHNWQFGRNIILAPAVRASWANKTWHSLQNNCKKYRNSIPKRKRSQPKTSRLLPQTSPIFFSILDYEIVIPISIRIGRFVLTPSATAVFPLAIFDGSRDQPFLNAELTATIDWIW